MTVTELYKQAKKFAVEEISGSLTLLKQKEKRRRALKIKKEEEESEEMNKGTQPEETNKGGKIMVNQLQLREKHSFFSEDQKLKEIGR